MLGKLLKYEIKGTARIFLPFYGALIILALVNRLFFFTNLMDSDSIPVQTTGMLSMMAYGFVICAIFALTLIIMIQRFYKNLLGDEGYLMFTLPVRSWMHIASKSIVSVLWIGVSVAITIISAMVIMLDGSVLGEIMRDLVEGFSMLTAEEGINSTLMLLELLLLMLVICLASILQIYTAISIGQFWSRHKVLGAFGAYIGLNTINQILFTLGTVLAVRVFESSSFTINVEDMIPFMHGSLWSGIVWYGIVTGVYFFITNYILSKHLNLE